jgi:hypothetical protein
MKLTRDPPSTHLQHAQAGGPLLRQPGGTAAPARKRRPLRDVGPVCVRRRQLLHREPVLRCPLSPRPECRRQALLPRLACSFRYKEMQCKYILLSERFAPLMTVEDWQQADSLIIFRSAYPPDSGHTHCCRSCWDTFTLNMPWYHRDMMGWHMQQPVQLLR